MVACRKSDKVQKIFNFSIRSCTKSLTMSQKHEVTQGFVVCTDMLTFMY